MKVGMDAVTLGCWTNIPTTNQINALELGSGTGIISLMLAQRLSSLNKEFHIKAIDIDKTSIVESDYNFNNSPWKEHLSTENISFQDLFFNADNPKFDLIFSNPPYFINSLQAPEDRRNNARHATTLSHSDIILGSMKLLKLDGILSLILPCNETELFIKEAQYTTIYPEKYPSHLKLSLIRKCQFFTSSKKQIPKRTLMEFILVERDSPLIQCCEEKLTLNSDQYNNLTKDFYLYY